jgi:hypothetical protein
MYLAVTSVKALENYRLLLTFENDEKRVFDVSPFLDKGMYSELKDPKLFQTIHVSFDSIQWANQLDFDPEFLYKASAVAD